MDNNGGKDGRYSSVALGDDDFELLSRYLDGELPPETRGALDARLARDPEFRACLDAMRGVDARLREAMTAATTVPVAVQDLLKAPQHSNAAEDQGTAKVLPFPDVGTRPPQRLSARWPQALAASMVLAVSVMLVTGRSDLPPAEGLPGNDALVSAALDSQASGSEWLELADGRSLQPVLTFEHRDGSWCREYLLRGSESDWRGVACRVEGRWETQAAGLESFLEATDAYAYRTAGAEDSAPVAVFISQHAADIALGLEQEQRLINHGWD